MVQRHDAEDGAATFCSVGFLADESMDSRQSAAATEKHYARGSNSTDFIPIHTAATQTTTLASA